MAGDTLATQRANFLGSILTGVAYGIHVTIVAIVAPKLFRQARNGRRISGIMFGTLLVMFALGTVLLAGNTRWVELMFVDERDTFPGGPDAFIATEFSHPSKFLANVAFVILVWLNAALMSYRCLILYNYNYIVLVLPMIMYLGCIATSILTILQASPIPSYFSSHTTVQWILPFAAITIALNFSLTFLIVFRILMIRRLVTSSGLNSPNTKTYTGTAAIIIESAALHSAMGLAFLVTFVIKNPVADLFLMCLGEVTVISAAMIMFRVAEGSSPNDQLLDQLSAIHFEEADFAPPTRHTNMGWIESSDSGTPNSFSKEMSIPSHPRWPPQASFELPPL